jgi:ribosome-associated protein
MTASKTRLEGENLIAAASQSAFDKKAESLLTIDMRKYSGMADWFLICESDNTSHGRAIADGIIDDLEKTDTRPWHVEGKEDGRWVLLDYSDTVIHIMTPEIRRFYRIEELLSSCPQKSLTEKPASAVFKMVGKR